MELKRYQEQALERLSAWFRLLSESDASPAKAWERLERENGLRQHYSRVDSSNRPIPHVCLRVPTGGGKTLLAAESLVRWSRRTGLVLWVVPSRAIHEQTKRALWNKEHPYRQTLERASDGRVKVLEKDDSIQKDDIDNYLCVILLSLQSANRSDNKEFLKMFQDSGRYSTFFPDEDDEPALRRFLNDHSGLDTSTNGRIRHTLANVFKVCRPVMILDEAHKSYGKEIDEQWLCQFDPALVLELSATPDASKSNILVNIGGIDLKEEEMIKLPIHVTGHGDSPWKQILTGVEAQLSELSEKAELLHADTGTYIRPMALVRVTHTGKGQIGGKSLHAEHVREHLIATMGIPSDEVRVQSSESKELTGEDLMSEQCRVRWIITKDALREGWDCSNAYILVLLDSTRANITMTQMMGRVLRQPYARLTGITELDRCYIHCGGAGVDDAINRVKNELEREGFGDLLSDVTSRYERRDKKRITRRMEFEEIPARLPQVLRSDGNPIDYEPDILAAVSWNDIGLPGTKDWDDLRPVLEIGSAVVDIEDEALRASQLAMTDSREVDRPFDLAWYVRQLRDAVPNPWQAARVVTQAAESIRRSGKDNSWIFDRRSSFLNVLELHVRREVDQQAEKIFKRKLSEGAITFDMTVPFEFNEWYEVPVAVHDPGLAFQRSLFFPVFKQDMNDLEMKYAGYLDRDKAIRWWHRVAARSPGEYRLQGWRRDWIYPDFVAIRIDDKIMVHETKGKHLQGNDDTEYKARLLNCLQQRFNASGTINLHGKTMSGEFKIVFENEVV